MIPITRDDVMHLPAGRDMDALVAQRILGLTEWCECGTSLTHDQDVCGHCDKGWLPPTSADIGIAWRVVEKLCADRDKMFAQVHVEVGGYGAYFCRSMDVGAWVFGTSSQPSPALAICRAALLTTLDI